MTTTTMRASSVRSLVLVLGLALIAAWTPATVEAATCPKICDQKTIWGTGPAPSYAPCECTSIFDGLGSGPNSCVCGKCYQLVAGRVTGYGPVGDGTTCVNGGTFCGGCDLDETTSGSGSSGTSTTKTTAPPSTNDPASNTPAPSLTTSAPTPAPGVSSAAAGNATLTPLPTTDTPAPTRNNTETDVASSSNGTIERADGKSGTPAANTTTTAPPSSSTESSSSNDGLATWQIALIICSCILVMAVAMMTITSCYCKARNRMKDNMQNEDERHEYEGYWNPNASGGMTERSVQEPLGQAPFNPAMTMGGRSSFTSTHSRPNSTKNMPYSEPTYAVDDRIGAGMNRPPARQSIGNSNDLPGVFQPFPQRDVRPSHEVGSRKNIAIEL